MSFHFPGFRFATYPTDKTEFLFLLAHKLLYTLLWAKMLREKKFARKKWRQICLLRRIAVIL